MARRLAAVPDAPGRVVAYLRVSALMGRGAADFHSPELQHGAIRRHVAPLGLREVAVIQDIDVSGRTFSREGLDQIRQMVEAGRVDVVAVYDLSRLGRNAGESLQFIRWLRQHRVSIISTVEKIDDTPEGQFILTQFLGLAELYSNQIGRRWGEVIAYRARQGYHNGGAPLGYMYDPGIKTIRVDPVLGPVIAEAFRSYARGVPIADITKAISKARGRPTQVTTVKRVLFNPTYVGKVALWGLGRHRLPNHRDVPAQISDGVHEPLVDPDTWELCQARHARDSKTVARHLRPTNPLVGVLFCQHCEHAMQYKMDRGKNGRPDVARMRCGWAAGCRGAGFPAVDDCVTAVLEKVAEHIKLLRGDRSAQAAAVARAARAGLDVDEMRRELAATRTAMGKLASGWAGGRVPDAAYESAMPPLQAAEAELADRLANAERAHQVRPPSEQAALATELLELWPEMTTAERNRALKDVVRRATVCRAERYREPVADRIKVDFW